MKLELYVKKTFKTENAWSPLQKQIVNATYGNEYCLC